MLQKPSMLPHNVGQKALHVLLLLLLSFEIIITSFLPSLSSTQTLPYASPCLLSNLWPFFPLIIVTCIDVMCLNTYIHIYTQIHKHTYIITHMYSCAQGYVCSLHVYFHGSPFDTGQLVYVLFSKSFIHKTPFLILLFPRPSPKVKGALPSSREGCGSYWVPIG